MKCMLFAAGLGTRLRPLTDTMPKALVPVGGRPLLQIVLEKLVSIGATEVVVNVHHFASQIRSFLSEHDFGVPVKISDESEELLDTGGGLKNAAKFFTDSSEPILIHNVDVLSNANLSEFFTYSKQNDAALLVSQRNTSRYLLFNDEMNLCGWTNTQTGEVRTPYRSLDVSSLQQYAFSGIHLFSPLLFADMETFPRRFSIIDFYLSRCAERKIKGVVGNGLRLLDVGKTATLSQAEEFLKSF